MSTQIREVILRLRLSVHLLFDAFTPSLANSNAMQGQTVNTFFSEKTVRVYEIKT